MFKKREMCNYSAEHIKAIIIDWLLEHHNDIIIGNEVMYGSKRKVVDLLAISGGKTIAIEIKSATDKLSRLQDQIEEYSKIFDLIIIVSAPSHIPGIKKIIGENIGLYSIENNIIKIQKPMLVRNHDKLEMLYSISSSFLKKQYSQYKSLKESETRLALSKTKMTEVHQLLVSFYRYRLTERFQLFMRDRGEHTLIDDIPTLSLLTRIDLF